MTDILNLGGMNAWPHKRNQTMPSRETLEELRRMPPDDRRKAVQQLSDHYERSYFKGTPSQIARRFERMRKTKDEANKRILKALSRAEPGPDDDGCSESVEPS
jgi:hypothetical protein